MCRLILFSVFILLINNFTYSQYLQEDSLSGFNESEEIQHLLEHDINPDKIDEYLRLSKRRFIDKKYELGFYAPPKINQDNLRRSQRASNNCGEDNWGFENGNFDGWNATGAVAIVNSGNDPYGGYPWVYSGNYSARISSDDNCCKNGRLDKTVTVPTTGTTMFSFHFAMSIFNFPHTAAQASKLWVEFFDQSGNKLACPQYECYYSSDFGAVGVNNFQQTAFNTTYYNPAAAGDGAANYPVTYADWNTITMDLSGYAGQQITAVFRVEWCIYGPDWSYVLVDVDCPISSEETQMKCADVTGSESVCGVDNMQSYTWFNPNGDVIGNTKCITVTEAGIYKLEALPANVECSNASMVTFEYKLTPNPISDISTNHNSICLGGNIEFTNNTVVPTGGIISTHQWDYGDGIITPNGSGNIVGVPQTSGNYETTNEHIYNVLGPQTISLISETQDGCKDTTTYNIIIVEGPEAVISGDTVVCQGTPSPNVTFTGSVTPGPFTFTYSINGGPDLYVTSPTGSNTASVPVPTNVPGTYTYVLNYVLDPSVPMCEQPQIDTVIVVVNPLPTAIIGTTATVCEDDAEPVVTFTGSLGTSDYTFTYTLNSGANQTISTTGSSTTSFTIPTVTAGVHDYLLLNVLDISTGCSQSVGAPNNRTIITVNPKPDAVITGATVVCQNDVQPFITFTGSNSTGSYSFVYTVNGGPEQTVTSTGGNNFSTVSVPTNVSGSFTYELVRVFDPVTGCVQLINEVQEVVVNPLPTASISGATVVCQNDVLLPKITFTGNGGTSEYTFRYSINGGAPQTVTTSGSNSVTVDVPTSVATTYTYALISVTDVTTGCIQNQVGSAVVKINPTPTGTTSGSVEVCQDATAPVVTFTGSNSTGSYTFSYQINGGPIESITANGATSIGVSQATNIPDTFTYTLLSVHDPITMCSLTTNSITEIIVRPLPIAQISGPQQGCYFDTNLPEVDFTGQNGDNPYTFTYNINGGSPQIATSSSGAIATLQHSTNALGTFVYTITHIKEGSLFGCEQNQSVSTLVTINNLPTVLAGDDFPVCEGEPIILTGAGAQTYVWDNGVVNGQPYTPTTIGSTTYTVIGTDHNGCSNTDQIVVTVIPIPVMDIIGQNLNGCQPLEPIFTNNSTGNLAKCTWYLGNGEVVNNCGTFSSIFPTAGCFDVTLEVETPEGCKNSLTLNNYVCVQSTPVASFTANPSELTSYNWESQMENTTIGATSYEWNFGDGSGSNLTHSPLHAFPNDEGGSYFITLVASTTFGCRDTATAVVNLKEDMLFFVPNTFTPDGDIHNNTFEPIFTTGYNPYKYTMVIYNRWGEKVFETNDTKVGWDGTYGYDGGLCQSGTYTWKIEVSARLSEERKTYTGTINLLK